MAVVAPSICWASPLSTSRSRVPIQRPSPQPRAVMGCKGLSALARRRPLRLPMLRRIFILIFGISRIGVGVRADVYFGQPVLLVRVIAMAFLPVFERGAPLSRGLAGPALQRAARSHISFRPRRRLEIVTIYAAFPERSELISRLAGVRRRVGRRSRIGCRVRSRSRIGRRIRCRVGRRVRCRVG